jgi:hypothetical protein
MRMLHRLVLFVVTACIALSSFASDDPVADTAPSTTPAMSPANYGERGNWLCWPGRSPDACLVDLTTTVIDSDGRIRIEKFRPDPKPPIDCFYVYPTVSNDPGLIATLAIEPEERLAVSQQLARFGARCRLFAPLYRQITLMGLRGYLSGQLLPGSNDPAIRDIGYHDVTDAWQYYLTHENRGRGVVLIGHSQGSNILIRLIKSEIDGQPSQGRLVSAILMGANLAVPKGADVGGDFKSIPLCRRANQTGCAIAFVTFRAVAPPPPNSLLGRLLTPEPGIVAACVNPAALGGGPGELKSYLSSRPLLIAGNTGEPTRWAKDLTVTTPFVEVPHLLTARCVSTDEFNYLAVTVNAGAADRRSADIPGDIVRNGVVRTEWGLHLIDANLPMGNLLDIVRSESTAWTARKP